MRGLNVRYCVGSVICARPDMVDGRRMFDGERQPAERAAAALLVDFLE
jgi:hypothetical protein